MSIVPDNFKDRNICILGLGYVGLTLATVMAEVGFKVLGVEIRDEVLNKLNNAEPHFYEPGLSKRLKRVIKRKDFRFSKNIPAGCEATVYIITVGTPLGQDGKCRMDMVTNVSREITGHLKNGDIVIMRSTVKVGTTRKVVMPILEEARVDFALAFCSERTIEGQALMELRQLPQIVGGITLTASVRVAQIFQFITPTVVHVSDVETAEIIKMIDNAQRDVSFAYANEVARICDSLGISAAEVIRAGKLGYPRTNLPMPGLVGGPCLGKDPYILSECIRESGVEPEITVAARIINERQPEEIINYLANIVQDLDGFPKKPIISLMGIAFKGKPPTDDLRGTMARPVFESLRCHFPLATFRGYDPVVSLGEIKKFGLLPYESMETAMRDANLVLIVNNHADFEKMPIEDLAGLLAKPSIIYDFWNNFTGHDLHLPEATGYIALGSHSEAILPWRKI